MLGIALALALVGLVAVPMYAWSRVQRVDATPAGDRPSDQPGTTFLLVGSDSREGLTRAERRE
ncbi:MAG: LytR family transcriptional regulator, partial [Actinomycetes bacterium]